MKQYKLKKPSLRSGFSLTELLVAMAILAVLTSLGIYTINVMNKNNRNTKRTEVLNKVKIGLEQYYVQNGKYPTKNEISFDGTEIKICLDGKKCSKTYDITASANHLAPSTKTTREETAFCFNNDGRGNYGLAVLTEGRDTWTQIGTASADCTNANLFVSGNTPQGTPQGDSQDDIPFGPI